MKEYEVELIMTIKFKNQTEKNIFGINENGNMQEAIVMELQKFQNSITISGQAFITDLETGNVTEKEYIL